MSKHGKLLEKLANENSDANWTLDDVTVLLTRNGYQQTGGKGSHRVFTRPGALLPIVLAAHGKKMKPGYVEEIRARFQELGLL